MAWARMEIWSLWSCPSHCSLSDKQVDGDNKTFFAPTAMVDVGNQAIDDERLNRCNILEVACSWVHNVMIIVKIV
jgi:hypothetical protein